MFHHTRTHRNKANCELDTESSVEVVDLGFSSVPNYEKYISDFYKPSDLWYFVIAFLMN